MLYDATLNEEDNMGEQALAGSSVKSGPLLAGLSVVATGALLGWAQTGPGFGWDRQVARLIGDTIPWLTEMSQILGWPLGQRWPFAVCVGVIALLLSLSKRNKDVLFVLSAVAGGVMMDWAFSGLLPSLPPSTTLLIYCTFLGSITVVGQSALSNKNMRALFGTLSGILLLAVALTAVHAGNLPSAVALSILLAFSWLMILRHVVRA